jgi:hypothetical protein
MKIKGKPKDFARKAFKEFDDKVYRSPQDELKPEWDFSGFVVLCRSASTWPATSPTPNGCRPGRPGTNIDRRERRAG